MSGLDPMEVKWSLGAFVLATIAGIAIRPTSSPTTRSPRRARTRSPSPPTPSCSAGLLLLLCAIGFVALWKRKRTLVAFDLFLLGFGFTLFVGLVGFVFILLGGWLLLRAWRLNKYGTTNSKAIASQVRDRPADGIARKQPAAGKSTAKTTVKSGTPRPPTANKRYTPKSRPGRRSPNPRNSFLQPATSSTSGLDQEGRAQELEHVGPASHQ